MTRRTFPVRGPAYYVIRDYVPPTPLWLRGLGSLLDDGPEVCVSVHACAKKYLFQHVSLSFSFLNDPNTIVRLTIQ